MPLPVAIQSEVAALNAAYVAASPLESASDATVYALATQSIQLVEDTDAALAAAVGDLDAFPTLQLPQDVAAAVLGLLDAAQTQTQLSDLAGFAGRVASNLTNA